MALPALQLGGRPVELNADAHQPSIVGAEVRTKVGAAATIFQRMNETGDMLRVATNVIDQQGERAVGTYIPATNPDGRPNPESAAKVKTLVDEISKSSGQQSQGITQVAQAFAQIEKVTHTTAATAEESAAASEELNAQAEMSKAVVVKLGALIGAEESRTQSGSRDRFRLTAAEPAGRESQEGVALKPTGTHGRF